MLFQLGSTDPLIFPNKNPLEKILQISLRTVITGKRILTLPYLPFNIIPTERLVKKYKLIKHNPQTPNIQPVILLLLCNYFRTPVQSSSNCCLPTNPLRIKITASQINYLHKLSMPHYILQLYVPMDDMMGMQLFQSATNLIYYLCYCL